MQKLVFKNGNGVEIDLTSGDYGITTWEGFSADGLNIQSQQVPMQDGGVFLDALLEQRTLNVTLAMNDEGDLERRYRNRRELIALMNPKAGEGILTYTNDFTSKQIHVIPELPIFETHNSNDRGTPKASLTWVACNPYWEDVEETSIRIERGIQVLVQNEGDIKTFIKGRALVQSGKVKIENVTSKTNIEVLNISESIKEIEINTNVGQKTVNGLSNKVFTNINISFNDFTKTGNKFIVACNSGLILEIEGDEKKEHYFEDNSDFYYLMTDETYIYAAQKRKIYRSQNLNDWELIKETTRDIYGIFYSDHKYFLLYIDELNVSTDFENWINPESLAPAIYANVKDFKIFSDKMIIVFEHKTYPYATSQDGLNWIFPSNNLNTYGYKIEQVENNYYILAGIRENEPSLYKTTDLLSWQRVADSIFSKPKQLLYNDGILFVVQENNFLYSGNFINFSVTTLKINKMKVYDYLYGCGNDSMMTYSENMINFYTMTSFNNSNINNVIFKDNNYYIFGKNITKTENLDYSDISVQKNTYYSCCYAKELNLFVCWIPNSRYIHITNDLENFTTIDVVYSDIGTIKDVAWNPKIKQFCVIGSSSTKIAFSSNAIDWTFYVVGYQGGWRSISVFDEYFYLAGELLCYGNTNGFHSRWYFKTDKLALEDDNIDKGCVYLYNGKLYITNGNDSYSTITYELDYINDILFEDNLFYAVGNNGVFLLSADGYKWDKTIIDSEISLKKVFVIKGEVYLYGEKNNIGYFIHLKKINNNYINHLSVTSNMMLSLDVGDNTLTGDNIVITYRQKYLGV